MDSRDNRKATIAELIRRGKAIYWKMPAPLRWPLFPVKMICKLFTVVRPDVWIMRGNEQFSGQPLGIIFAGLEIDKNYIRTLAFGDSCREQRLGRTWLWNVRKASMKSGHDCALLVIEAPHCSAVLSRRLKYLLIPTWVDGELNIAAERAAIFKTRNKSLRSDLCRIRKHNLQYEAAQSLSQLDDFYHNMYLPYTTSAHGDSSKIMTYGYVKAEFKKRGLFTDLILIKENGQYIAGILLCCEKDRGKLSTLGVKDGNLDYLDHGAVAAAYHFAVQYLVDKGYAKIDFGGSRPFLKDGVLRYKRKWRQEVSSRKEPAFLLKVLSQTPGLTGFLANNPFMYKDAAGLKGAVFVEAGKPLAKRDCADIYRQFHVEGMSKLVLYRFDDTAGAAAGSVPPELADKMTIAPAESLLKTMC